RGRDDLRGDRESGGRRGGQDAPRSGRPRRRGRRADEGRRGNEGTGGSDRVPPEDWVQAGLTCAACSGSSAANRHPWTRSWRSASSPTRVGISGISDARNRIRLRAIGTAGGSPASAPKASSTAE